jgi:hypothetical protein
MRQAVVICIRSFLKYDSVAWNLCLISFIDLPVNAQRNFSKGIPSLLSLSYLYPKRLSVLHLEPLVRQRLRAGSTNVC